MKKHACGGKRGKQKNKKHPGEQSERMHLWQGSEE
jgi:hypothetical protein